MFAALAVTMFPVMMLAAVKTFRVAIFASVRTVMFVALAVTRLPVMMLADV